MARSRINSDAERSSLDRYLREISVYAPLSRAEEAALGHRIRRGDEEAVITLVRSNLRFVVSVAKEYCRAGVPISDLINEGNIGLLRAARNFDERRGVKFISYAVVWVRRAVVRALARQGRTIRLPPEPARLLRRLARRRAALSQELGHRPTNRQLADAMGLPPRAVRDALALDRPCASLDAPAARDADGCLLDILPDSAAPAADERADRSALSALVADALTKLSVREATVLRLYFGIGRAGAMSLERIAGRLNLSRERVRRIKDYALLRLRHRACARTLRAFHEG